MKHVVVQYPSNGNRLPPPWQHGWAVKPLVELPPDVLGEDRTTVCRAPEGTPLPAGAKVYEAPVATSQQVEAARRFLEQRMQDLKSGSPLLLHYRAALSGLEQVVQANLGKADSDAWYAPMRLTNPVEAGAEYFKATDGLWISNCSSAVIRPAPQAGYMVWTGLGSCMELKAKRIESYAEAESMAVRYVREHRQTSIQNVTQALSDWADSTPLVAGRALHEIGELPIQIHRGPIMGDELGTSWDLPVVAVYRGDVVERHDERVTWDDDASRRALAAREQTGADRRSAVTAEALAAFAQHRYLCGLVSGHRLRHTVIRLEGGQHLRVMGEVGMDGAGQPTALILEEGASKPSFRRLGELVTQPFVELSVPPSTTHVLVDEVRPRPGR